jgi:carboxypeptidase family protein
VWSQVLLCVSNERSMIVRSGPRRRRSASVHPPARAYAVGITLVSMIAPAAAIGQSAQPKSGGSIVGVVFDSLVTNLPISGAEVTVDGRDATATTDSRGRFRLDGRPPAAAVVRFYHATLDSLGFGAPPVSVTVPDSGVVEVGW